MITGSSVTDSVLVSPFQVRNAALVLDEYVEVYI